MRVKEGTKGSAEGRSQHQGPSIIRIKKTAQTTKADRIDQYANKLVAKITVGFTPNSKLPLNTVQRPPSQGIEGACKVAPVLLSEDIEKHPSANVPGSPTEGSTAAESSMGQNVGAVLGKTQRPGALHMEGKKESGLYATGTSEGTETRILKRQQQKLYMEQLQEQIKEKESRKAASSNACSSPYC